MPRSVAQMQVSGRGGTTVVKRWEASEIYPCFVSAAWSADSRSVVALYRDCWHGSEIVAFDVTRGKTVSADQMKEKLAQQIDESVKEMEKQSPTPLGS